MERPLTDLPRPIKRNDLHIALQKLDRYEKILGNEPVAQAPNAMLVLYFTKHILQNQPTQPVTLDAGSPPPPSCLLPDCARFFPERRDARISSGARPELFWQFAPP